MSGFRAFLARGNVVDLAVGVIIGAAFGGIVDSLTKDIITPLLGVVGGQPDFSKITLFHGTVMIGNFMNAVIAFVIKAAVVYFGVVKPFTALMERLRPSAPAAPAAPAPEVMLLTEIRDVLKQQTARS